MAGRTRNARARRFLAVIGPDGVGKTTLIRGVTEAWPGATAYVHFRPRLGSRLAEAPPENSPPPPPKAPRTGSLALGWLRLALAVVRFWFGYLFLVKPALRRGALVVADRWSYVYVAQPFAAKFYGPPALARAALRVFPRPDMIVNLQASPAVIHARKPELTIDEIVREMQSCATIEPDRRLDLDASQAVTTLVGEVIARILDKANRPFHTGLELGGFRGKRP